MNIYGKNTVIEALKTRDDVSKIIISTSNHEMIPLVKKLIKNKNIEIQELPLNKMNQMFPKNHQGIVATVNDYQYVQLEKLIEKNQNKQHVAFVILDGLEDPHNLGSIIRTAETAGVHGIIIPKRRAASVNSTVSKVSCGAVQYMKIARVNNISDSINKLKENGVWVCGTAIDAKSYYFEQDFKEPIAIVIGNEGKGMSQLVKKNCDFLVKIPMKGKIQSLNASVSTGIVVYEVLKQRNFK